MAAGFATSTAILSPAAPVVSSPVKPADIVKHYGHFAEATVKEPEKNRTMAVSQTLSNLFSLIIFRLLRLQNSIIL